jgi:predicted DNA repair protein MutK
VCDDLRLLRDVASSAARPVASTGVQKHMTKGLSNAAVHRCNVLHLVGMIDLRVAGQQSVHHRDAAAGADVPRPLHGGLTIRQAEKAALAAAPEPRARPLAKALERDVEHRDHE